jgi:hypothetical protein
MFDWNVAIALQIVKSVRESREPHPIVTAIIPCAQDKLWKINFTRGSSIEQHKTPFSERIFVQPEELGEFSKGYGSTTVFV